jgi:hypothetical protein
MILRWAADGQTGFATGLRVIPVEAFGAVAAGAAGVVT